MDRVASLSFCHPAGVAPPIGSYSHLVSDPAGARLLVVAGQVGVRADGTLAASFEGQFDQALRNALSVIGSQGATAANIIKLNTWAVAGTPIDFNEWRSLRASLLGEAKPPSTFAYVSRLFSPEFLVELEAWAAVFD